MGRGWCAAGGPTCQRPGRPPGRTPGRLPAHCTIKGAGKEESPERPVLTMKQVFVLADAIDPRYRMLILLATFATDLVVLSWKAGGRSKRTG